MSNPTASISPSLALVTPSPVLPLWEAMRGCYLDRRPMLVGPDGLAYPDTNCGDVRRVAARMSAALEHPRFDQAGLVAERRAWRAALRRLRTHTAGAAWHHRYPDNLRFWTLDGRQLAEALRTVDQRRDAITAVDDLPVPPVAYLDPSVLCSDLRHWYLLRRPVHRDRASLLTYPATTIRDAAHVAGLLHACANTAATSALCAAVDYQAARRDGAEPYPDAAAFWCEATRGLRARSPRDAVELEPPGSAA